MHVMFVDFSHEVISSDTTNKIQEQSNRTMEQHPLSISLQEKISQLEPMSPHSNEAGLSIEKGKNKCMLQN